MWQPIWHPTKWAIYIQHYKMKYVFFLQTSFLCYTPSFREKHFHLTNHLKKKTTSFLFLLPLLCLSYWINCIHIIEKEVTLISYFSQLSRYFFNSCPTTSHLTCSNYILRGIHLYEKNKLPQVLRKRKQYTFKCN